MGQLGIAHLRVLNAEAQRSFSDGDGCINAHIYTHAHVHR